MNLHFLSELFSKDFLDEFVHHNLCHQHLSYVYFDRIFYFHWNYVSTIFISATLKQYIFQIFCQHNTLWLENKTLLNI